MSVPSSWANVQDWMRMVATALNPLTQGYPYISLDGDPTTNPLPGFTYFNTTTGKVRTWDGSAWQDHW